jgi:uncharacterized membrane protein
MGAERVIRKHDISRLEAFSDVVFGLALALLAVSADPPTSYAELMNRMAGGISFACCFALLVWIWHEHNSFFRRFGLQDFYTIFLNSVLLFVVLLYVYPLKFMFDSLFERFVPRGNVDAQMELWQLGNAAAVYAAGFIAVFGLLALLYRHAVSKGEELRLTELELFDARTSFVHHLISSSIGVVSLLIALAAPLRLVPLAPMAFFFMGPGHWYYGVRSHKRRAALEERLAEEVTPVA